MHNGRTQAGANPAAELEKTEVLGVLSESTHTVDMPGIDVVTRSRALRVPCWVIVAAIALLPLDGYWGSILALFA